MKVPLDDIMSAKGHANLRSFKWRRARRAPYHFVKQWFKKWAFSEMFASHKRSTPTMPCQITIKPHTHSHKHTARKLPGGAREIAKESSMAILCTIDTENAGMRRIRGNAVAVTREQNQQTSPRFHYSWTCNKRKLSKKRNQNTTAGALWLLTALLWKRRKSTGSHMNGCGMLYKNYYLGGKYLLVISFLSVFVAIFGFRGRRFVLF